MIRIGKLLPSGERVSAGPHRPIKGFAEVSNDIGLAEELVVFAKELGPRTLSIELVSTTVASVARATNS